jgi:23S rRNA (cytosine1962-C5)-methyltransferase
MMSSCLPAFIKRSKDHQAGIVAYQRLNEMALKLLAPGGILVFCSCSMHLSMEDMMGVLQRSAYRAQCDLSILERGHQGPDHPIHLLLPAADYLKAIFVRKIS